MKFAWGEASIRQIIVHQVGNKAADENYLLSERPLETDEALEGILCQYFLSSIKSEEYYRFQHDIELPMNEVYTCVARIFENADAFTEQSAYLAKHLYGQSAHPKVKGGEFYVVHFRDTVLDGQSREAVGLFRSENRDTFLEVNKSFEGIGIESREGININKLDKGCLVFNTESEKGFVLAIVDNTNKGNEAQYWKDLFLNVAVLNNDFHQTNQFLGIAKQFVTKQLQEEFEVTRADQIDFLNRSVDYFKSHNTFDKDEFEQQVFADESVIRSFRQFDESYRNENEMNISDSFEINAQAVRKQARVFKSVLKLDKNFHIYIHGNRELIEQGVDENGRKFYKIYYDEES
ncbi:nucleoid-associated protein [Rurimicrobium arvi]|uniref:Nucleoid-associated protein n=1 Tax=Rurimicrobium arvi TaxID=2049916 RepID=A0ABP8MS54_9BACT